MHHYVITGGWTDGRMGGQTLMMWGLAASDCAFVQGPWGLASSLRRRAPIASVCALRSCANSAASAAAAG